jgi:hypothetical protein
VAQLWSLDVMSALSLRRWRFTLSLLSIHTLLVCIVYASYMNSVTHHYEDPEMQWFWASIIAFPSSGLIAILHPQYGLQCAIAFLVVGGIQWGIIGAICDGIFSKRHNKNI